MGAGVLYLMRICMWSARMGALSWPSPAGPQQACAVSIGSLRMEGKWEDYDFRGSADTGYTIKARWKANALPPCWLSVNNRPTPATAAVVGTTSGAGARDPALLASVRSSCAGADRCSPPALLASAPPALVRADARAPALLASAPFALVRAMLEPPHSLQRLLSRWCGRHCEASSSRRPPPRRPLREPAACGYRSQLDPQAQCSPHRIPPQELHHP